MVERPDVAEAVLLALLEPGRDAVREVVGLALGPAWAAAVGLSLARRRRPAVARMVAHDALQPLEFAALDALKLGGEALCGLCLATERELSQPRRELAGAGDRRRRQAERDALGDAAVRELDVLADVVEKRVGRLERRRVWRQRKVAQAGRLLAAALGRRPRRRRRRLPRPAGPAGRKRPAAAGRRRRRRVGRRQVLAGRARAHVAAGRERQARRRPLLGQERGRHDGRRRRRRLERRHLQEAGGESGVSAGSRESGRTA